MKIIGHANIYREPAGKYGFDYSIFVYSMAMAADDASGKTKEIDGHVRILGRAIPVEIEVPDESGI